MLFAISPSYLHHRNFSPVISKRGSFGCYQLHSHRCTKLAHFLHSQIAMNFTWKLTAQLSTKTVKKNQIFRKLNVTVWVRRICSPNDLARDTSLTIGQDSEIIAHHDQDSQAHMDQWKPWFFFLHIQNITMNAKELVSIIIWSNQYITISWCWFSARYEEDQFCQLKKKQKKSKCITRGCPSKSKDDHDHP